MHNSSKQDRNKLRLALLLVGVVGLAISTTLYLLDKTKKEQLAASLKQEMQSQTTLATVSVPPESKRVRILEVIEDNLAEDAPIAQAELAAPPQATQNKTNTTRKAKRHNASKHIAHSPIENFPAPANADWLSPKSEVEMWSGTKRSLVVVPPGAKFE